jgi:hypothetical protein
MSSRTLRQILHLDFHFHPCRVQVVQKLSDRDKASLPLSIRSDPMAAKIARYFCTGLLRSMQRLKSDVMPTPSEETWKRIADEFCDLWKFPNYVGALDEFYIVHQLMQENEQKTRVYD